MPLPLVPLLALAPLALATARELSDSGQIQIPRWSLTKAQQDIEQILAPYKALEGPTTATPASPNSSRFLATHSGSIQAVSGERDPSGFLLGVKIGTNFSPYTHSILEDPEAWQAEHLEREALIGQIKSELDTVLVPFIHQHQLSKRVKHPVFKTGGSAYSIYGVPRLQGVTVVDR